MIPAKDAPALSVILPCEEGFAFIRRTVRALQSQTIREQVELVIVRATESVVIDPRDVTGFHSVQVLLAPGLEGNHARAVGVRAARGPIVVSAEDHCFPESGWAAALVAAHAAGWTAVGPTMCNANPESVLSWVNLMLAFGPWVGSPTGPMLKAPWHNSSYKRAPLLECGDRLGALMEVEGILQADLAKQGHRFYHEAGARVQHLNISRPSSTILFRLMAARLFAARRAHRWSVARRLLYIAAAPLIPWVRLWRAWTMMRAVPDLRRVAPRILPALFACLVLDSIGETAGYAAGDGDLLAKVEKFERQRYPHLSRADQRLYDAQAL